MRDDIAKSVAVVVPAFNEETRIASVLRACSASKLAGEIIVVSDGSLDRTADVARKFPGVRVIELRRNVGKGGAMAEGVRATKAQFIEFLDADLIGLRPEHVDMIIRPLLDGRCDMAVGVFRGGKMWSDTAMRITPSLSGQRAMKREVFESVPNVAELRMGVEYALTNVAKRKRLRVLKVVLRGVSNCHKEEKMGFVEGLKERTKMYVEITETAIRTRRRRRMVRKRYRSW